ncbi:MAG: tetratricopeptide repeat protein [Anaerolineae bacterium]|nr:tetratricopeptide repeat protein [Anaerolineae bacterium]
MNDLLDRSPEETGISIDPETTSQKPILAERYEVVNKLAGGMGLVYLCRDIPTNQLVALKTFKPEYLSHRMARDLFLREGTMWVELGSHPNIVRAYRVERIGDGREVYLVLEWIVQPEGKESPSLRSWMRRGRPLSVQQALLFTLHIVRGMKHATHKIPGLVHRDLKPENVLVGHDGVARVTDFGLAGTLTGMGSDLVSLAPKQENFGKTQLTRGVVGTPLYMAPEQWLHEPLDARADMYALGCILYEMVSGRFAAEGETREQIREIHLSGAIKEPSPLLPKEVVRFLLNCLMVNPDHRFRNWLEMEEALTEVYKTVVSVDVPTERIAGDTTSDERIALGQSYNTMGLSYLDIGKLDVAVMYFEQAVIIARAEKASNLESAGLGNLGIVYREMGYGKRSVEFHEEQLTLAHETGNRAEQGRALGELGQAYRALKDPRRAIRFHEQQLAIAQELGDRYKEAAALDSLALSYHQLDNVEKAVALNKQSLAIATSIGDQARVKSVLSHMGRIYLDNGDTNEASALFKQSLALSRQVGDRIGEGESFGDLGDLYLAVGQADRAIELYKLALKIAQESKNGIREIQIFNQLGDLHFQANELSLAESYYRDALTVAKQMSTQASEMDLLGKLGDVFMVIGDSMQAASFYKRQLAISRDLGNREAGKKALVGIGESYELWGDPTRAIDYFEKYLAIARKERDWVAVTDMLYALGERYRKVKQLVPAYHAFEEYVALMDKAGNQEAVVEGLNQMGNVARDGNNNKNAIDLYRKAVDIARANEDLVGESWTLGNMGVAYNLMGKQWQATRLIDKSLKTAEKSRKKPPLARAHYRAALVAYRQEKWDKAVESGQIALDLYDQMDDDEMQEKCLRLLEATQKRS